MKFVCDNCQAKYQIGDDKVAGRTVRMKCRRCGHDIRVRADGAAAGHSGHPEASAPEMEAPASLAPASMWSGQGQAAPPGPYIPPPPPPGVPVPVSHAPPAPPPRAPAPSAASLPHGVAPPPPRPPAASAASLPHGLPAPPPPRALTTSSASLPRGVPAAPPPRAPLASGPHGAPAARPPAPPAPARPAGAAPPASAARLPARPVTRASSATLAAVRPPEVAAPPPGPTPEDEATVMFAPPAAPPAGEPHAAIAGATGGFEWFVGIAGIPTGPLRVSTIGERAAAGEVDGDSLVWREGISEWRPLKTFPDLLAVVTAAKAPPVAPAATYTPSPAAPLAAAPVAATVQPAPVAPAAPAPVSHVLADPFAAPAGPTPTNGKSNGLHLQAVVPFGSDAPRPGPDPAPPPPVGADAPASAPAPGPKHDPQADLDLVLGRKQGGGTHPMAYAFIAAAAVFGGVAAYVLLSKPQVVVVSGPVVQVAATAAASSASAEPDKGQVEVGEVSTGAQPGSTAPRLGLRPKGTASATPVVGTAAPIDTSGFVNNVPGPAATPGAPPPGGGGQLSQGEISAVVSQNQPLVKRKCWQPAIDARPPNGPTTARVNGSITISASGAVDSAAASGAEKDFPGLSSCIQGRMKGWKFPPSGGSTTVNVPFVFAGQ